MKILLTGGSGYIGSVTTEMLCDGRHDVTVFDNLERGHIEAVDPRARLVVGDLRDPRGILDAMRAVKPDAVVHFAAYALVGESMQDPMMYFDNNTGGGLHLLDAMLKVGVKKIIFSSTCATYGQPDKMPMDETLPQRPTNPYGESKLMFETALRWEQQRRGIQPVFLRYFNACGASAKYGEDHDPRRTSSRTSCAWRWARRMRCRSSATTTPLPTVPASATTSTSSTSPAPTSWRWRRM